MHQAYESTSQIPHKPAQRSKKRKAATDFVNNDSSKKPRGSSAKGKAPRPPKPVPTKEYTVVLISSTSRIYAGTKLKPRRKE